MNKLHLSALQVFAVNGFSGYVYLYYYNCIMIRFVRMEFNKYIFTD